MTTTSNFLVNAYGAFVCFNGFVDTSKCHVLFRRYAMCSAMNTANNTPKTVKKWLARKSIANFFHRINIIELSKAKQSKTQHSTVQYSIAQRSKANGKHIHACNTLCRIFDHAIWAWNHRSRWKSMQCRCVSENFPLQLAFFMDFFFSIFERMKVQQMLSIPVIVSAQINLFDYNCIFLYLLFIKLSCAAFVTMSNWRSDLVYWLQNFARWYGGVVM